MVCWPSSTVSLGAIFNWHDWNMDRPSVICGVGIGRVPVFICPPAQSVVCYSYSLEQTQKYLHCLLDVGPVKTVVATDSGAQHNHTHTLRTPSKERVGFFFSSYCGVQWHFQFSVEIILSDCLITSLSACLLRSRQVNQKRLSKCSRTQRNQSMRTSGRRPTSRGSNSRNV